MPAHLIRRDENDEVYAVARSIPIGRLNGQITPKSAQNHRNGSETRPVNPGPRSVPRRTGWSTFADCYSFAIPNL